MESQIDNPTQFRTSVPPLVPVPSWLARATDQLCVSCSELELTPQDFVPPLEDDGVSGDRYGQNVEQSFGLVRDVKSKSVNCPLCRVVLQSLGSKLVPDEEDGVPTEVVFSWDSQLRTHPNDSDNPISVVRRLMTSLQKQGGGFSNTWVPLIPALIGILANDAPTRNKSLLPRIIQDQIDFGMVRNWIDVCDKFHKAQCDGVHPNLGRHDGFTDVVEEIPTFRVIDVVDKCITLPPRNCKYVALSYVWGNINPESILRTLKSNAAALEKPGSLTKPEFYDKVPIVIRDAMYVVGELHMRYLWVDSLCIIQDDDGEGESKMQSIAKMSYVYGAAALTLTTASGIDANTPLPGVHPGIKRNQAVAEISPGFRLAFQPLWEHHVDECVYFTRGWTFQEMSMTKRNLLFIGGQVVFSCGVTDQCREDEVCEDQHALPDGKPKNDRKDDIGEVEEIIYGYTSRSLTYNEDIYHAIAAMFGVFKRVIDANLCHGIPDTLFDWFLLWEPNVLQTRRSGGPSWSWSGWIGQSSPNIWDAYTRSIIRIRKAQKKRTWIIWYQREAHDSHHCVRVDRARTPSEDSSSTKRMQKRFSFDCTQTQPTALKLSTKTPVYTEDTYYPQPGSGFLQFWTISVQFNLDILSDITDDMQFNIVRYGYRYASILGRGGKELGNVMVNPVWLAKNVPGRHEFILICEGRTERVKKRGDEDKEPGWKYRTMLIDWKGPEGQWAERVAVGAIEKKDLDEALEPGAVWKEIVLG